MQSECITFYMTEKIPARDYRSIFVLTEQIINQCNGKFDRNSTRKLMDSVGELLEFLCIDVDSPNCFKCPLRKESDLCLGSDNKKGDSPINYLRYIYKIYLESEGTIESFTNVVYQRIEHSVTQIHFRIRPLISASSDT